MDILTFLWYIIEIFTRETSMIINVAKSTVIVHNLEAHEIDNIKEIFPSEILNLKLV